jgi:hypothetical protein
LNHRNPAHEDRGEKSAEIAHDAAAERDHYAGAIGPARKHLFGQRLDFGEPLALLTAGEIQDLGGLARGRERVGDQFAVWTPHIFRGDDENFARFPRKLLSQSTQYTPLDQA